MIPTSNADFSSLTIQLPKTCLAIRVNVIHRAIMNLYNHALSPHKIRVTQLFILSLTANWGSSTATRLSEALFIDPSTVSRNLERMKKKNWVSIEDVSGKRTQMIKLTPSGTKLLQNSLISWKSAQQKASHLLKDQGVEEIHRLAEHLKASAQ